MCIYERRVCSIEGCSEEEWYVPQGLCSHAVARNPPEKCPYDPNGKHLDGKAELCTEHEMNFVMAAATAAIYDTVRARLQPVQFHRITPTPPILNSALTISLLHREAPTSPSSSDVSFSNSVPATPAFGDGEENGLLSRKRKLSGQDKPTKRGKRFKFEDGEVGVIREKLGLCGDMQFEEEIKDRKYPGDVGKEMETELARLGLGGK